MTDKEEALNRKLYEKVSAEMEAYENELLAMPPEEILEHAYAYATKQDIVLALEEYDLSEKQVRALLQCDNALGAITFPLLFHTIWSASGRKAVSFSTIW